MLNIALDAKLRGCDLVRLRLGDIAPGGVVRQRSTIILQKTGRPVPFEITEAARDALAHWLERRGRRRDDWLFPSRSREGAHKGSRPYLRLQSNFRFPALGQCPVLAHLRRLERILTRGRRSWEVAMSQPDLFRLPRKPWNAGRMTGAKAPLKPKHIWAIRQHLKSVGSIRDLAMFNIALDAKLRGCDLVKLRLGDIAQGGVIRQRSTIVQQKTGRPVPFEITEAAREALGHWLERRGRRRDDWLFPSRSRDGQHIGTRQYARLVDAWVRMIDLNPSAYGTHSLRRTKVALIYKKTGNLRACQLLLGHGKLESTVRYLGIEVDDALEISEQIDL